MTNQAIIDRWHSLTPAERDMWVRRVVFPEIRDYPKDHWLKDNCPTCGYDALWPGDVRTDDSQPYAQHPAAAWLVVERMRERGKRLHLIELKKGMWQAEFLPIKMWWPSPTDTEAEAICLAALLALAGEEG